MFVQYELKNSKLRDLPKLHAITVFRGDRPRLRTRLQRVISRVIVSPREIWKVDGGSFGAIRFTASSLATMQSGGWLQRSGADRRALLSRSKF